MLEAWTQDILALAAVMAMHGPRIDALRAEGLTHAQIVCVLRAEAA